MNEVDQCKISVLAAMIGALCFTLVVVIIDPEIIPDSAKILALVGVLCITVAVVLLPVWEN